MASNLLLEDGSYLLLENSDRLRLDPTDATKVYLRQTVSLSTGIDTFPSDMFPTAGTSTTYATFALTVGGSAIPADVEGITGVGWYSERAAANVTLTSVQFRHYAVVSDGAATIGTLRVKVWIQGSTPGYVERLIADYLGGALPVGVYDQLQEWELPLVDTPTVLARGERLVCRVTGEALEGETMEDGAITLVVYGGSTGPTPADVAVVTEPAITFVPNRTRFYLRRTTASGIGSFFDLLPAAVEQSPATAVVNTFAGSSGEAQWTQTAGGSVIEWVSPRFTDSWYFEDVDVMVGGSPITLPRVQGLLYLIESNALANTSHLVRLYRRRGSVETTVFVYDRQSEEPLAYETDPTNLNVGGLGFGGFTTITPTDFQPDDRLVVRLYLVPLGTMASGHTATLSYDGTSRQSYLDLFDVGMGLKDEADPDTEPTVPDGMSMTGMGN